MIKTVKRVLALIGKPIYFLLFGLTILPVLTIKKLSLIKLKPGHKKKSDKLQKNKKPLLKKGKERKKLYPRRKYGFAIFCAVLLLICSLFYFFILKDMPSPKELASRIPEVSTKIYDRNGELLYKIYKDENRTIIPIAQIPQTIRLATLAAEDAEFYTHPGFSVRGIFRAMVQDIKTGSLQGGSTITQQLVKNTLLTPEKTIIRKVREIILSIEIEALYTKDEIFEMYLNEVSYGGTAYGIKEAADYYFGKNVEDLDLAESALLAGLPKSPTTYSPFGSNPELAFERQREILNLMVINKYITRDQAIESANKEIYFTSKKTEIKAPHFVMYVRQILVDKYGEDIVEKGGLEVTTSLDLSIQEIGQEIVADEIKKLEKLNVGNGAALVVNPQTGEILAMVGSKDYFDIENDGNVNVLNSLRQPGSSIKIVNYTYALSNGYTSASIIDDSPITFYAAGTTPYSPVNYDGKYRGNISLRNALAESRNIPAVKVLASYGVNKMIEQGQSMGITTWGDPSNYGLSLTLGGGAVKALELSKVYATLANSGKTPELMPILEVKNYKGEILEKNNPYVQQTIDPRIAFLLTDILKDNFARTPEFGSNSYLVVKNHPEVAVKTGTSNDLRDNWTIGYNQNYLVLAWVGNNDNSPMSRIASGVTGASPIWNKIMSTLLNGQTSIDWEIPEGVSKVNICSITGTLPCNGCITKQEWFLDENIPNKHCIIKQDTLNSNQKNKNQILDSGVSTEFNR